MGYGSSKFYVNTDRIKKEVITECFICGKSQIFQPGIVAKIYLEWVPPDKNHPVSKAFGFVCDRCMRIGREKYEMILRNNYERKKKKYVEDHKKLWSVIKTGVSYGINWHEYRKKKDDEQLQRRNLQEREGKRSRGCIDKEMFTEYVPGQADKLWAYLLKEGLIDAEGWISYKDKRLSGYEREETK